MKRGTIEHPKTLMLADRLNIRLVEAVGHLEALWHFVGKYSPQGDVGKWGLKTIAAKALWDGDAEEFVQALEACGWLDRLDDILVVHDWPDHADSIVHASLARQHKRFADGTLPDLRSLHSSERKVAEDAYLQQSQEVRASTNPPVEPPGNLHTSSLVAKPSQTMPSQAVASAPGNPREPEGGGAAAALRDAGVAEANADSLARGDPALTALDIVRLRGDPPCKPGLLVRRIRDGDRPPQLSVPVAVALAKRGDITTIGDVSLNHGAKLTHNDAGIFVDGDLAITPDMLERCEIQTRYDDP